MVAAIVKEIRGVRADVETEALRAGKGAAAGRREADAAAAAAASMRAPPSAARAAAVAEHAAKASARAALVAQQAVVELKGLEAFVASADLASAPATALANAVTRGALARCAAAGVPVDVPAERGVHPKADLARTLARFRRVVPEPAPLPPLAPLELPVEEEAVVVAPPPRAPAAAAAPKAARPLGAAAFFLRGESRKSSAASEAKEAWEMKGTKAAAPARAPASPVIAPKAAAPAAPPTPDPVVTPTRATSDAGGVADTGALAAAAAAAAAASAAAAAAAAAAPPAPIKRERRARRSAKLAAADGDDDATAAPAGLRRSAGVVSLFAELARVMPDGVMGADYAPPSAATSPPWARAAGGDESDDDGDADPAAAAADAARHARLLKKAASDVVDFGAKAPASVADLEAAVAAVRSRLSPLVRPAPTLAALGDAWPAAKWAAMTASSDAHAELDEAAARLGRWVLQRGSAADEGRRVEAFLDAVRARVDALGKTIDAASAEWAGMGVPADTATVARARAAGLHVASLYMARVLAEVASLERAPALAHGKCLAHLADAARVAHKAHAFAGGFDSDTAAAFDSVRSLTRYYIRCLDPTWLKDGTKLTTA